MAVATCMIGRILTIHYHCCCSLKVHFRPVETEQSVKSLKGHSEVSEIETLFFGCVHSGSTIAQLFLVMVH